MEALAALVRSGSRSALSKALTLIESTNAHHQQKAMELLKLLESASGHQQFRIGVSGPPGAGKSSLIETLGCALVRLGHKVAVLAVDPSSDISSGGGSILGDKTRMTKLSSLADAYIRPSPSRGTLGGVARSTVEAMTVCAAAGYNHLLVETVGVGQSEIAVANMVDCMILVLPPVGGDELQSIKRGITEVADVILVNKADGATRLPALRAVATFRATTSLRPSSKHSWSPVVLPVSAHSGEGIDRLLSTLDEYLAKMMASRELNELRARQRTKVAWTAAEDVLLGKLRSDPGVARLYRSMLPDIAKGQLGPRRVATQLIEHFLRSYSTFDNNDGCRV